MFRLAALFGLIATSASAGVSDCRHEAEHGSGAIFCDVTNDFGTAIAGIEFTVKIHEPGRTVAWVIVGRDNPYSGVRIPGGIEPGETRNIILWLGNVPEEADDEALEVIVTPVRYLDVNGSEISAP